MGRTILLERRQSESVGRRNSRTLSCDLIGRGRSLAEKWAWKWNWVDPKINDPSKGDLELKFKGSHAKIGGENKF
ncbi:hypothetical protein TNCV_2017701 [Trichonephila clavipes]|nr:hypothetical protein TNCV_2017701 [Trichonephila clavipes]